MDKNSSFSEILRTIVLEDSKILKTDKKIRLSDVDIKLNIKLGSIDIEACNQERYLEKTKYSLNDLISHHNIRAKIKNN